MTMFTKGTWTLLKLNEVDKDNFTAGISESWKWAPVIKEAEALLEKSTTFAISPFSKPRMGEEQEIVIIKENGEVEALPYSDFPTIFQTAREYHFDSDAIGLSTNGATIEMESFVDIDSDNWKLSDGVFAFWLTLFTYVDVHDVNSKKEDLAYAYGAPFKFQPGELKKEITDTAGKLDTVSRKQYQVILDFNRGRAWINATSKEALHALLFITSEFNTPLEDLRMEADYGMNQPDWPHQVIDRMVEDTILNTEFIEYAEEVKAHTPTGAQLPEDAVLARILKTYWTLATGEGETDYYALSTPLTVRLSPTFPSTITYRTPYEATFLINEGHNLVFQTCPLTFVDYFKKEGPGGLKTVCAKQFSVDISAATIPGTDLPGFVVRGLNIENFKDTLKTEAKVLDGGLTIKEYWNLWYQEMDTALFRYLNFVKDRLSEDVYQEPFF